MEKKCYSTYIFLDKMMSYMLYKMGFFCFFCFSLFSLEQVYLKTPNLSQNEFIGTHVGIRPFRKTGVRIEAETFFDKLIIHNYGYGGSGLTLSFGGVNEVLKILESQKTPSKTVAILGAGVAGLTTAYDLLEKGYEVHIYSYQWSPHLTSNVAAGIWSPLSFPSDLPEEKKKWHLRMLETAEQRFLKSTGDEPEFAGVSRIPYYSFRTISSQEAIKTKHRGDEVVVHFDNGISKNGRRVYEIGIDGKLFMEDLFSKVKSKGAILHQKQFESIEDLLPLKETIIINCMSLGSRELFNDHEFIPVRGQIVYFKPQEGIDYLLFQNIPEDSNSWVSIYPWRDRIILGGIYEYGEEEPVCSPAIIEKIIQNAKKCLSGLWD